ncbi:MAG: hypothetical protein WC527_03990 [Candidatus Margulisiibacteriota bacterium]
MRKAAIIIWSILTIVFTVILAPVMAADIELIGAGARSISLGRAYVGEIGDSNSIFSNPAGLGGIGTMELSSMFANFAGDVTYTNLNAAIPTEYGNIGIGYLGARVGNLVFTTIEANGRIGSAGEFSYGSNIIAVAYSRKLWESTYLGITGKYYNDGSSQVANGSGASIDIGAIYKFNDKLRLGLSGQNILNTGMKWDTGITDPIPYNLKAGLIYQPNDVFEGLLDVEQTQGRPMLVKAGLETKIWKNVGIRIGAEQMTQGQGENYFNYSAGVGLAVDRFRVDYAYYRDMLVSDNSTHFVSFTIDFPAVASWKFDKKEEKPSGQVIEPVIVAETPVTEQSVSGSEKETGFFVPDEKEVNKIKQPTPAVSNAQGVRDYLNLLDSKIKKNKAKGNTAKVKELKKEKNRTLRKWKAEQEKTTAPKPAAKKAAAKKVVLKKTSVKKVSSSVLAEKKAKNYIKQLNSKIKINKARGNTVKVKELQQERQMAVDRWNQLKSRSPR